MNIPMKSSLAAVALVALAGIGLWSMNRSDTALPLTPVAPANAEATTADTTTAPAVEITDMRLGNPDAKVTLIEYASYTCPHCANFHTNVFGDLKKDYIDTGKINFVYREVYFDRYGLWASMLARCGGEMRYFGIHDILYATQQEWAASGDANVVVGNLKKIGLKTGMDAATIDACMQDATTAQALIDHYEANMKEYDITGTPSLVINGSVEGNMSYADLKSRLDAELAK